jgi:hypothetical protein
MVSNLGKYSQIDVRFSVQKGDLLGFGRVYLGYLLISNIVAESATTG